MSIAIWLYLAGVVGSIEALSTIFIVTTGLCVFLIAAKSLIDDAGFEFFKKYARPFFIPIIVVAFIVTIIPSQKTIYMILGVKVADNLALKSIDSKIPDKVLTLINQKLDESIDSKEKK